VHFLHARGELGIRLRRDYPILNVPRCELVFLSVRRRVTWQIDSTISSVTACSARSRSVQLANPFGGRPNRNAMIFASCSPSRTSARTRLLFAVERDLEPADDDRVLERDQSLNLEERNRHALLPRSCAAMGPTGGNSTLAPIGSPDYGNVVALLPAKASGSRYYTDHPATVVFRTIV
jgi:hypothetical protein